MSLRRIQEALCELYDLELDADVLDFVCDAEMARAVGGADARGEALLVAHDDYDEDVEIGLYVDPDALERLGDGWRDAWLDDARVQDVSLATEGVSHFVYLVFRARAEHTIQLLELELQAEVDKYASAVFARGTDVLEGNGVGAFRRGARLAHSRAVRERLFGRVRFLDAEETETGERYRVAHRLAARYAAQLEERFVATGELGAMVLELRRFYRRGLRGKVEAASAT